MQVVHPRYLSLRKLVLGNVSQKRVCILTTCLGLLLSQGCALPQQPTSNTAAPSEPTLVAVAANKSADQPAPSQRVPAQPTAKTKLAVPAKLPQTGEASWYGTNHQGKKTASGTIFDQAQFTAAHPSLPFGSKIKVTNLANGKSVEVEITDRRPAGENRIIDLSQAAARALAMIDSGTATVRLELSSSH